MSAQILIVDDEPNIIGTLSPLLRTPRQGADTIAWLAASPEVDGRSGLFFLDREARPTYRKPGTRRLDEARERARLWSLCQSATDPFRGRVSVN